MNKKDAIELTIGSHLRVKSLGSKDQPLLSYGIFKGYTVVGSGDGVCIELDEVHKELAGKIRIIPSHMIMAIDILSPAKSDKSEEKELVERYFG